MSNVKAFPGATQADQIRAVFDHYRRWHPRAIPNPRPASLEWRRIAERLAEGFTVRDLTEAIDGMHRTPFNLGDNERGHRFLDLALCMRSASHVQRYLEAPEAPEPVLTEKTRRTLSAAASWVKRKMIGPGSQG